MRIRILPCSPVAPAERQDLIGFLVEGVLAVDAGGLGLQAWDTDLPAPADVLLTHAHLDHVATLPFLLEDRHDRGAPPVRIHGPREALAALRAHLFHPDLWVADAVVTGGERPWAELRPLEPERTTEIAGLRVTPVPVPHTVPTFGYVVDDGVSAVAFGADAGPTERLWEVARATGRLRAAFIECSFPDTHAELAARSAHLTPRLWPGELARLPRDTRAIAVHIKPRFRAEVLAALAALGDPRIEIGVPGREVVA